MTSRVEQNSYLRVYGTNITNHLPGGGVRGRQEAWNLSGHPSCRDAENRGSGPTLSASGGQEPAEGERKRRVKPQSVQEPGKRSPLLHCRGDFKFLFRASVIKTVTQKSWKGQPTWKVKDLRHPNVRCTFPPVPREGTFYIKEQGTSWMWMRSSTWPPPPQASIQHSSLFPLKVIVLVTQSCPTLCDLYGL